MDISIELDYLRVWQVDVVVVDLAIVADVHTVDFVQFEIFATDIALSVHG